MFLAPSAEHVPPILVHHVERSRSLYETVILLTVEHATVPVVPDGSRARMSALGDGFHRLVISLGLEEPLLLPVLETAATLGTQVVIGPEASSSAGKTSSGRSGDV